MVVHRIERLGFWMLASSEKPPSEVGPNGETSVMVRADGAQWIVEGVKDGAYHVVDRLTPKNGPAREIGMMMLDPLAKMEFSAKEVY